MRYGLARFLGLQPTKPTQQEPAPTEPIGEPEVIGKLAASVHVWLDDGTATVRFAGAAFTADVRLRCIKLSRDTTLGELIDQAAMRALAPKE